MNARTFLRALLCAAVFSVAASASAAEEATAAPLKIGIVGTGNIGGALAKHWARAGHELIISSRHPEELQSLAKSLGPKVRVGTPLEAAQFGDVILLSVPYKATPQVGQDLASAWKGKIVLDTGNPYPSHRCDFEGIPAGRAPGARVQRDQLGRSREPGLSQARALGDPAGERRRRRVESGAATGA